MPIPGPTNFTKNSEVENAETSAIGRALAMIGYHPKETMASGDEIKAKDTRSSKVAEPTDLGNKTVATGKLTETKKKQIFALGDELGLDKKQLGDVRLQQTGKHSSAQMTEADGDKLIAFLQNEKAKLEAVERAAAA